MNYSSQALHINLDQYTCLFLYWEKIKKKYHSGLTSTHSSANKSSLSLSFSLSVFTALFLSHTHGDVSRELENSLIFASRKSIGIVSPFI